MPHLEFPPSDALKDAVQCFWWHEETHSALGDAHTLQPDSYVELGFHRGETWLENNDGQLEPLSTVYVLGLQDAPLRLVSKGLTRVFGVRFFAWSGLKLLGLAGGWTSFQSVVGESLLELSTALLPCLERTSPTEAVALLEPWLLERQGSSPRIASQAGRMLHDSSGGTRVAELAAMLNVSERQLERVFQQSAGASPKTLARLIRFQRATERIHAAPGVHLTSLAFELGYADQAHFIRDFSAFAGVTPSAFAAGHGRNVSDLFNALDGTSD